MNKNPDLNIDAKYSSQVIPEFRMEFEINVMPVNRKEKLYRFLAGCGYFALDLFFVLLGTIGAAMFVGGLAYVAGIFFKAGMK